jgi:hydroxyacylglutathione hydrolase
VQLPQSKLVIESFPVGKLGCNCTIVACPETHEGLVVDPGDEAPRIVAQLQAMGVTAIKLVHTHAHFDHVMATDAVAKETKADTALQAAMFGLPPVAPGTFSHALQGGEVLRFGRREARVIHTPGHTPGSICLYLEHGDERPLLFSGDTLFAGSVGRTDLWGGSFEELSRSIRGPIFDLPESTLIIPGHGDHSTIGMEREDNPFVGKYAAGRST